MGTTRSYTIYTRDCGEHYVQPTKILSFPLCFMNILEARILERLNRDFAENSTDVTMKINQGKLIESG